MSTHVSAETVTSITAAPAFSAGKPADPAPSVRHMIREVRKRIEDTGGGRAQLQLAKFNEIVSNTPAGFQLAPVFYSRTSTTSARDQHNGTTDNSFCSPFIQYIAEHHQDELRRLGISDYGISYMIEGVYPIDENGQQYRVNVDHVIEIAGSGTWASETAPDPLTKDGAVKLRVNHFSNMILVPEQVHAWKNELNEMQGLSNLSTGEGKWALMLVPVVSNGHSGFIAPPQKPGHPLAGLQMCDDDFTARIQRAKMQIMVANDTAAEAACAMTAITLHPVLDDIVTAYISPINPRKHSKPANDNSKKDFLQAMNKAVRQNKELRQLIRNHLVPTMLKAAESLTQAFNMVAETTDIPKARGVFNAFSRLYRTGEVREMREAMTYLPLKETEILKETFRSLDEQVDSLRKTFADSAQKKSRRADPPKRVKSKRDKKNKQPKNDNDASASHRKKRGPGRWSGRGGAA